MIDWSAGAYGLTATQLAPAAGRAVAAAAITPGERVLDVACGTGTAAILAAMGGAQVVGVDLAERLLQVAAGRPAPPGWRSTGGRVTRLRCRSTPRRSTRCCPSSAWSSRPLYPPPSSSASRRPAGGSCS